MIWTCRTNLHRVSMYTAQTINLKNHINQNNCTEKQVKQTRVNFLNVYLQFKIHKTLALTAKKGL